MNQNEQMREALREIEKKAHDSEGASGSTEVNRWFAEIGFLAKKALASEPAPSIEDGSQNWEGMDGASAFQIIERHADGWADIGKMMQEWLDANTPQPAKLVRLTEDEVHELWSYTLLPMQIANAIMDAMERKNGGGNG